ncbi:MAG: hypothetical protein J6U95_07525 [Alistipes sp.]|nr:hypothetical protein [Alistipes sp.]
MRKSIFCIFALALLTLVGCEEKHEPYYVLYVVGTVVDEAGEPIQGIHAYPEGGDFAGREGYTNYEGKFGGHAYLAPRNQWTMIFEDVDGDYNGGEYERLTIDISQKVTAPIAPDEWGYSGSGYVELGTIVLKKK